MLLPDNIKPELCIYYNGSLIINELRKYNEQSILDLFDRLKKKVDMSFSTYLLCLDWLYLIDMVEVNEEGRCVLCI